MRALLLTAVVALSMPAIATAARPGTLDESFGGDGRVETRVAGGRPAVAGIEARRDGKLLLAGTVGNREVVLIRYRRDGTLDKRFGHKGVRSLAFDRDVVANDVALDARGRLLMVGALGAYGPGRAALVLRFDPAGRLDSSFDGDGIDLVDFGGAGGDEATAVALQANSRIAIAARINASDRGDLGVARLNADGAVDESFGDRGFVRMTPNDGGDHFIPVAIGTQADGAVVIGANHATAMGPNAPFAVRLLSDGSPDAAFGHYPDRPGWWFPPGAVDEGYLFDLAVHSGRIFVTGAGYPPQGGSLSLWLAEAGIAPSTAPQGGVFSLGFDEVWGRRLVVDGAGRPVVAGSTARHEGRASQSYEIRDIVVARFDGDRRLNRCFGRGGRARISFRSRLSTAGAVTIGERNRIVVAGPQPTFRNERTSSTFQLARLHGGRCQRR
jgi:uncharacterized delta-60 repeat protein